MSKRCITFCFCLLPCILAIWPQPRSYSQGATVLRLSPELPMHVEYRDPTIPGSVSHFYQTYLRAWSWTSQILTGDHNQRQGPQQPIAQSLDESQRVQNASRILDLAIARFRAHIAQTAFVPWKFHPPGQSEPKDLAESRWIRRLDIRVSSALLDLDLHTSEAYALQIPADGSRIGIEAESVFGALHALTTLQQLFWQSETGELYTPLAPITLRDAPEFRHRGLNIDVARNFINITHLKRIVEGMALTRFNRLHIHATDSQSWPLEIPALPELATKGSYDASRRLYYTAQELQELQQFALDRGIETIVEIDMPGHLGSMAPAHPELITAYNAQPWTTYCAEPPCGQARLNDSAVTDFLGQVLDDLLPRMRPFGTSFHTGGDEVNANSYLLDPGVRSNNTILIRQYLGKFIDEMHGRVRAHGFRPVVWEELITTWNLSLPASNLIVQTWLPSSKTGSEPLRGLAAVTAKGYDALFGAYDHAYLDCGFGSWVDPSEHKSGLGLDGVSAESVDAASKSDSFTDYCSPYRNWRQIWAYEPRRGLTATQRAHVLGGEIHLWAELTDSANLDTKLWPRAAAAAELLWSGERGSVGLNGKVTRRLAEVRERLLGLGIAAEVVQPTWCLQHGGCSA